MTFRTTLTAVALATMTLSGCSSMGGETMTAPAAMAPAATEPMMVNDGMEADDAMMSTDNGEGISDANMSGNDDSSTNVMAGESMMDGPMMPDGTMANRTMTNGAMTNTGMTYGTGTEPMMVNDGMMADDAMMSNDNGEGISDANMSGNDDSSTNVMAGESMADMADMSGDDAVMNACFQAGGQVVSWVGDSTGATQACRREDGLEYRLADAQYYQ